MLALFKVVAAVKEMGVHHLILTVPQSATVTRVAMNLVIAVRI